MILNTIFQKLILWDNNPEGSLNISGVSNEQWIFLLTQYLNSKKLRNKNHILLFKDTESTEKFFTNIKNKLTDYNILLIPGMEISPYSGVVASERNLFERFYALSRLTQNSTKPVIALCTVESFLLKNPHPSFFKDESIVLETSDIISPLELSKKLVSLGYTSTTTVEEPGTFSLKGEIFDIFPMASDPIRIQYFDDMIEEIFAINKANYRTKRELSFKKIEISAAPQILLNKNYSNTLKESIPMPSTQFKKKHEKRKSIFNQITQGFLFENYPAFLPLFFKRHSSLIDFFDDFETNIHFIESFKAKQEINHFIDLFKSEYTRVLNDINNDNILPSPENLYFTDLDKIIENIPKVEINDVEVSLDFQKNISNNIECHLEKTKFYLNTKINPTLPKHDYIKALIDFIKEEFKNSGEIVFVYSHEASKKEFIHLMDLFGVKDKLTNRLSYLEYPLSEGFYYKNEKLLLLSEADIFNKKTAKTKVNNSKNVDLFAEQLSTLKAGDYVIHNEHGLGEYLGLESIEIGNKVSDYLVLVYSGNDKIYVPVYKMNLIQKHAEASSSLKVDSLRTNKFSLAKKKARESAKKLAFDLLKLQAERESSKAFSFSPPDHDFKEFELSFPFDETPDQTSAIEEVIIGMQKNKPMDHLVCGDVGFGKTEVAMRAAFKAILDHKQVAILVPTTILALQHYNSFKNRFCNFAANIQYVSRFKTAKETREIIEDLATGKVDIIIGTHKLLSGKIKFNDLGLVIVDEEQRFGVGHKEKLKLLKTNVDFLTLTATPIPRTLQMAFLGLRDLSLIKTAPPKRQSIKTYIIKEDDYTLQNAIKKEILRGGQVFIVHNRVQDIEAYASYIQDLVPQASIIVAHGQLPEKDLERSMSDFYNGKYQILISTTIIESGLDIPNANTMIVDRADRYGLSQLHQLRGRIGRSDKKAYAYFIIPNDRNVSEIAEKRLKALQTYADMGSGFNIANCDLEIRGAGDLLGANQSGHIDVIGLELYMELLNEAIGEIKGEKKILNRNIEINTPFPSYIPDTYIKDPSERLKQYKRLSNCNTQEKIEEIQSEFLDIFGEPPIEMKNLLITLEARSYVQGIGIKSVSLNGSNITLQFNKDFFEGNSKLRDKVSEVFLSRPKLYQFSPDYKVLYKRESAFSAQDFLEFCRKTAEQILPS